jgi:putative two-component system response regulator
MVQQDGAERILIVDDEPYVCEVLSRWLTAEGYDCDSALTAEEALEVLDGGGIGLLVTDIMLPGADGIELLIEVKRRYADVAVVMVTAVDDRKTAVRALESGAYGYVIKPFDRNEVIINVVNAFERRRLLVASRHYERSLEEQVGRMTEELRRSRDEIALRLIAAQEHRHDETGGHIRRIALWSEALGERLGYPPAEKDLLRLAAPMHDVGKIGIPDAILMKPGRLNAREWQIMKTHTQIGARILEGTRLPLLNMARQIALNHHERWDGSGYPAGLQRTEIPEPARIVAVLDVYDALVHKRVYRPAMREREALSIISQGAGAHFDPDICALFLNSIRELKQICVDVAEADGVPAHALSARP